MSSLHGSYEKLRTTKTELPCSKYPTKVQSTTIQLKSDNKLVIFASESQKIF